MKRRFFSLLLALVLAAGCGGAGQISSPAPSAAPEASLPPAAPSDPAEPEDPVPCTYRTLPGVTLPEAEPLRMDWHSAGLGESRTVTDPHDLGDILALLEQVPVYNRLLDSETARQMETRGDTLDLDFFADAEGNSPLFSVTFRPCRITVGEKVYGPFAAGDAEALSRIAAIANPTVPKSARRTLAELLGRPLPEGTLTVTTVAGPRGEEAFTPAPDTAAAIRRELSGLAYFTFGDIPPEKLPVRCLYRLALADPGEEPVILWLGKDSLVPEGGGYPEYIPYGDAGPLLALLAEETGFDLPLSTPQMEEAAGLAADLCLLNFEAGDAADAGAQRSFLAWQLDRMTGWIEPAETGEYRFPLAEIRELAARRLGVEDFDPLTVFADRLDQPGRWSWYDTARREYVIETTGGYGGAAALEPIRREAARDEAGALRTLRLRMGIFDLNLYHQEHRQHRLIGSYEVVFDFPGGDPENWRLVSAKKEEP